MLVDTNNLVRAEEFCAHLDKYVMAVRQGSGPIAITEDSVVVGFFISPEEYEAVFGGAIERLLKSRVKGSTVSHRDAKARIGRAAKSRKAS
jgi:PHD/YefM family antitoxin component YafN of YafNO toxin-antitoxin module